MLFYTVAKHSFPYSLDSNKNQEFNDTDITGTDISNIDLRVELESAINFEVPDNDVSRINLNVTNDTSSPIQCISLGWKNT